MDALDLIERADGREGDDADEVRGQQADDEEGGNEAGERQEEHLVLKGADGGEM